MSLDIWMQCEGKSKQQALRGEGYRVVEDQHQSSTWKLVTSREEHDLLERLLEKTKPPLKPETGELHYLLSTPFRYPPLKYGSRFGTVYERGIFYGSLKADVAFAETAFYKFYFLRGTTAKITPFNSNLTLFRFGFTTDYGIDLTAPPFSQYQDQISHPIKYGLSQKLGLQMRLAQVQAFLYYSARDKHQGKNIGVFSPLAFSARKVRDADQEQWIAIIHTEQMTFCRGRKSYLFKINDFLYNGEFPEPAP